MVFYPRPGGALLKEQEGKKRFVIVVPLRPSKASRELSLQKQQVSLPRTVKKDTQDHISSAKEITGDLTAAEGRELWGLPLPIESPAQE